VACPDYGRADWHTCNIGRGRGGKLLLEMNYATLCSGIEAPSMGWHGLGWNPMFFSEIEPFPKAVLKHHYPNVPDHGDMTKYKEWPNDRPIDLICAGTPCQSFSVAGLRKGIEDPRGNLTLTFLGVLERYRPTWVVWENVPGVLSDGTNAFGQFIAGLSELGYGVSWRVLDAQYFGVAQRRRRVFVVGCLGNWRASASVLFESNCLSGDSAPSREKRQRVTGTAQKSVGAEGKWWDGGQVASTITTRSDSQRMPDKDNFQAIIFEPRLDDGKLVILNDQGGSVMNIETDDISPTLRRETHGHEPIIFEPRSPDGVPRIHDNISPTLNTMGGGQREPCVAYSIQGNIIDRSDTAGANGKSVKEEQAFTLNTIDRHAVAHTFKIRSGCEGGGKGYLGQDEAAFTLDTTQSQNLMHTTIDRQVVAGFLPTQGSKAMGIGYEIEQAPTLRAGLDSYGLLTSTAIRRLTPIECERLQGFPDNYTQIPFRNKPPHQCPDGPRYKALGNSMAVPVLKWIGERINEINKLL
jgi:DNA (cytosine-5)-methyltransferase 1